MRRRVHDYIAAHLDQKIINDALAQIAGLSTAHFYVVFKQTEGMSPHCYVLQYRVRRTQQKLSFRSVMAITVVVRVMKRPSQ